MKKALLVGLAVLLVIAVSSTGLASAADYSCVLTISGNSKTWTVDANGFSAKDVDVASVVVTYWLSAAPTVPITIEPKNIHLSANSVTLQFDAMDLPLAGTVAQTRVDGTVNDGADTFNAAGPGFAWGRTR